MPPFALKLSWNSCCPPWCSWPSPSAGALCPGAQMEWAGCLHPASVVCVWWCRKMWLDFAKGSAQWCVSLAYPVSALPFTRDGVPPDFNYLSYCHLYFDQISFTFLIDSSQTPFNWKVRFCYRNQKARDKEGERGAISLCLKSCCGLV